jgi:CheY-like chemotaxis protein
MAGTTQSIKLLLVDDDDDLRGDLLRLFRKQGHEVTAADSGEDGLN